MSIDPKLQEAHRAYIENRIGNIAMSRVFLTILSTLLAHVWLNWYHSVLVGAIVWFFLLWKGSDL